MRRHCFHLIKVGLFSMVDLFEMPGIDDKNDTEEEDMDQDTPESDPCEDDDSELGSGSDGDDSSELDEVDAEIKRDEYLFDMSDLEHQFMELKEQLYCERFAQVGAKLEEVKAGKAPEYLIPLAQLQENIRIRTQVAGILQELRIQNIKNKFEAEKQASEQNYESEKSLLHDMVKQDLEEKIRRLEEDRHNIDITSDLWNETHMGKKKKKVGETQTSDRRRKPVTVSGPYIVYMLKESELIDDWTAIKKALKQAEKKKKDVIKVEKHPFSARYEDGKLFYEGDWYAKGNSIIIDNREDSPVRASITAINTGEVWVKRSDGNKSKLYIAQLQKGKYTIRRIGY